MVNEATTVGDRDVHHHVVSRWRSHGLSESVEGVDEDLSVRRICGGSAATLRRRDDKRALTREARAFTSCSPQATGGRTHETRVRDVAAATRNPQVNVC